MGKRKVDIGVEIKQMSFEEIETRMIQIEIALVVNSSTLTFREVILLCHELGLLGSVKFVRE